MTRPRRRELLLGLQLLLLTVLAWDSAIQLIRGLIEAVGPGLWLAGGVGLGTVVGVVSVVRQGGAAAFLRGERRRPAAVALFLDLLLAGLSWGIPTLSFFASDAPAWTPVDQLEPFVGVWVDGARAGMMAAALGLLVQPWLRGRRRAGGWALLCGLSSVWCLRGFLFAPGLEVFVGLGVGCLCTVALMVPRGRDPSSRAWLIEDGSEQVRLRLPGLHLQRVFDLFSSVTWLLVPLGIGLALMALTANTRHTGHPLDADMVIGALGMGCVWVGVLAILSAVLRFVCARWRAVELVLTPSSARVGSKRLDADQLILELVADGRGTMLVVGAGVVLSADVPVPALEAVLARVRRGLIREGADDRAHTREALKDFVAPSARATQIWLEVGRRRHALADLVTPSLLVVLAAAQSWDGVDLLDAVIIVVPVVFLLVGIARIVRMARASRQGVPRASEPAAQPVDGGQVERAEAVDEASVRRRAARSSESLR